MRELNLKVTPREASQLMELKEKLNRDGLRRTTSQVVSEAIRVYLAEFDQPEEDTNHE